MPHFFIPPQNHTQTHFNLTGEESHHLRDVLRVKIGDTINLFDGSGQSFSGMIESITKDGISGKIVSWDREKTFSANISLYCAIIKGERFDWLIEKAAEIGITRLIPCVFSRSIVREISGNKIERYRRISLAAAKQCGRPDIMAVEQPKNFMDVLSQTNKNEFNLVPWESEKENTMQSAMSVFSTQKNINLYIGPEGGFTHEEIKASTAEGFKVFSLGSNILRTETAAIVASVLLINAIGGYR